MKIDDKGGSVREPPRVLDLGHTGPGYKNPFLFERDKLLPGRAHRLPHGDGANERRYLSKERRVLGSGEIRAYSNLDRVTVGPASELYRASRRYGVYEWREILQLAEGDPSSEIMTLHFRDTELLAAPWAWGPKLQRVLGRTAPIQSPIAIDNRAFARIYGQGMEKRA